jgi:tripartite-type tricarboxylate transporter receptor subunit TctC
MKPNSALLVVATVSIVATVNASASAATWPAKPIRVVVPVASGSTVDIVPRIVFEQLSVQLGQNIIVDNRPGAGTTIGSALVAKADPDGYTLLVNSSAHTIAPALYRKLPYHPARDLTGVVPLGVSACVLVVSPAKAFKTAADLVNAAKARPAALNFSSVGLGTATHLAAERFRHSAAMDAVHVPFKGGAEAMSEVMSGRVEFFFGPVALVLPHVKSGRLTALAVNTSQRALALPDVPTTKEAGFTDAEYPFWFGVFAPARTPREILDRLSSEIASALQTPKVRQRLATVGVDPMKMSSSDFDAFIRKSFDADAALVKTIGLKLDS